MSQLRVGIVILEDLELIFITIFTGRSLMGISRIPFDLGLKTEISEHVLRSQDGPVVLYPFVVLKGIEQLIVDKLRTERKVQELVYEKQMIKDIAPAVLYFSPQPFIILSNQKNHPPIPTTNATIRLTTTNVRSRCFVPRRYARSARSFASCFISAMSGQIPFSR